MFPLTPPKQLTFLISVALAIAAVVVRYLGLYGRADAAGIPDWRVPAPTGCLSGSRRR